MNDSGPGSLRQAIVDANASSGADDIEFAVPGTGVQRIQLATALPTITESLTIAGGTQDPQAGLPTIELDGAAAGTANGLRISGPNVQIQRLAIVGFSGNGILLEAGATGTIITGSHIGVRADGATGAGNTQSGIFVNEASGVFIGLTSSPTFNLISGNTGPGITINGNATSNLIVHNLIGVAVSGTSALPNGAGIVLQGGASLNTIGSLLQGEGNVISGNLGAGISIADASTIGNVIIGNAIGTNASGTVSLGNGAQGISITGAGSTRIGGVLAGEGNTIASNGAAGASAGILLDNATQTLIQGNRIGTNPSGDADLGNGGAGVLIRNGSTRNRIGGTDALAPNLIAYNGRTNSAGGIVVLGASSTSNQFLSNSIFKNYGLGIDLGGDGVTPNDNGDGDSGPNTLQNFPIITNAATGAGRTLVQGTFNSTPSTLFLIQFFANDERDPTNFGEGQVLIGSTTVSTLNNGAATFNEILITPTVVGQFLTATATSLPLDTGNTSEFSLARVIGQARVADLSVTLTDSPDPAITGSTLTYRAVVTNQGPDPATNVQFSQGVSSTLTNVTAQTTQGTVQVISGGISGNLGTIPSGGSVIVTVTGTPTQIGPITSNIQVFSNEIDPNAGDNSRIETTTITNPTDLSLTVTPDANPVTLGQDLVYQILVANNGNFLATDVRVTSSIPDNTNLVGVFTSQGSAEIIGNTITAHLQSIAVGSAVAVRVILSPSAPGTYSETFNVSSNEIDTAPGDNTKTSTVVVLPNADLGVTLSATRESVIAGQSIDFVARATNNGPSPATNVKIIGALPLGLTPLVATVTDTLGNSIGTVAINGQNITASVTSLNVGATAVVTVTATPSGDKSGLLATTFAFPTTGRDQGDLTPGNDSASIVTAVQTADLSVSQELTPNIPILGQELTYAVRITNNGPATANNMNFTILLPVGASFVAGSVQFIGLPGTASGPTNGVLSGNISGTLAAGSSTVVTYRVVPAAATTLTSDVTVTLVDPTDPDTGNNRNINIAAVSPADLGISVTSPTGAVLRGDTATLTFLVTNNGPVAATNAVASINLNAGVAFLGASASQGIVSSSGGVVTANLGNVGVGAQVTIQVQVRPATAGTFVYTASIDGAELDNAPENDSTSFNLQVNDAPGRIQFSAATYQENEDGGLAVITLTRTGGLQGVVTVHFETTTGSARPNVNFTPVSGTATFLDGQTTTTINVPVLADGEATPTLNVGLLLTNPMNGASLGSQATATLQIANIDVDNTPPTVTETQLFGRGATISSLILQFSERLDASRANNPFNYHLFAPSGQEIALAGAHYSDDLRQVTIATERPLAGGDFYRLVVNAASSTGLTDLVGNRLAGSSTAGTDFVRTFARGTSLSYVDADGDRVSLRLQRGGLLEVIRNGSGNSEVLTLLGTNRRSTLTGAVRRTNRGGNGQTNLGRIDGASFGTINDRLTSPPFFVNDQFGAAVSLSRLVAVRRANRRG